MRIKCPCLKSIPFLGRFDPSYYCNPETCNSFQFVFSNSRNKVSMDFHIQSLWKISVNMMSPKKTRSKLKKISLKYFGGASKWGERYFDGKWYCRPNNFYILWMPINSCFRNSLLNKYLDKYICTFHKGYVLGPPEVRTII